MRLINYDFYDIHALICLVRSNPCKECYIPMLEAIIGYLEKESTDNGMEANAIRALIRPHVNEHDEMFKWVFVNNCYTANVRSIKNKTDYEILIAVLREIIAVKETGDMEKTVLLADAVHNIPCILVDEAKPCKRIAGEISDYRKRYNKTFLKNELKGF